MREMDAVVVFSILSVLLVLGKLLRVRLPILQRLYLPSSVIGGLLGLAVFTALGDRMPGEWLGAMRRMPGFLINVIFATLFLGRAAPTFGRLVRIAFPQLCLGQILAWGQYVVGLGVAGFLLAPAFGLPPAFGNLVEMGFEGGHGTVGGMADSLKSFGWADGIALGYTMATVGMILGIVIGMMLVQWAYRRGFVKSVRSFEMRREYERKGLHLRGARPSAGLQTVYCDSVDSLAWHVAIVGLAVLIGFLMLKGFQMAECALLPDAKTRIFQGFPLFPLCMVGGVLLQLGAKAMRQDLLVDRAQMERISGASLDYLVLAAVATIRLDVVMANAAPLALLIVAGTVWTVGVVLFVAPRIFKDAWFERAIAEFGQAMGVTATGLMLLRTVDPENKTPAAASFACKQLLHEPFMGGGIWTALALTLVFTVGWLPVWGFSCLMLAGWGVAAFFLARNRARP